MFLDWLLLEGPGRQLCAELIMVQIATDRMISEENIYSVTKVAEGNAGSDMTIFPDDEHPLYPKYIDIAHTSSVYWCDSAGLVGQIITNRKVLSPVFLPPAQDTQRPNQEASYTISIDMTCPERTTPHQN